MSRDDLITSAFGRFVKVGGLVSRVGVSVLEELDYLNEAENIRRMAAMHADLPEIIVPDVVQEATTRRVLTMEFVDGIPPAEAVSDRYPESLKDQWGAALFEFTLRGLVHQ